MFGRTAHRKDRRSRERRAFPDYMRFMHNRTGELVGDLADISADGFRLEGSKPVPVNADFPFRIDLPAELSQKVSMVFTARSCWSQPHRIDGRLYETGFKITQIDPGDSQTFALIFDRYGSTGAGQDSGTDYLWRT